MPTGSPSPLTSTNPRSRPAWLSLLAPTRPAARSAFATAALMICSCQDAAAPSDGRTCEQRRDQLLDVLSKTPEHGLAASIDVGLPSASLPGSFGEGAIVELSGEVLMHDGALVAGATFEQRILELSTRLAGSPSKAPVYVAAASDTTVDRIYELLAAVPAHREARLVFAAPPAPIESNPDEQDAASREVATRVLAERDAKRRTAMADAAYAEYASCDSVRAAVASARGLGVEERWPRLRASMLDAIPRCACDDLEADALRHLLVAEQRAGSVALGSAPASYLSQARCAAALTRKTVQQLLDDVGEFDAEFAGNWKEDALVFDEVATSERLLVYLCVALPDETLAWLLRRKGRLYFKAPGQSACQGWQLRPLQPGSPLGTWQRDPAAGPPLAVYYRLGPGDVRLFGPATESTHPSSKEGPWPCDEDVPLVDVDETSLGVQSGARWFFDEASCRSAPAARHGFSGCVANLAAGIAPPEPAAPEGVSETPETAPGEPRP